MFNFTVNSSNIRDIPSTCRHLQRLIEVQCGFPTEVSFTDSEIKISCDTEHETHHNYSLGDYIRGLVDAHRKIEKTLPQKIKKAAQLRKLISSCQNMVTSLIKASQQYKMNFESLRLTEMNLLGLSPHGKIKIMDGDLAIVPGGRLGNQHLPLHEFQVNHMCFSHPVEKISFSPEAALSMFRQVRDSLKERLASINRIVSEQKDRAIEALKRKQQQELADLEAKFRLIGEKE